MSNMQRGKLVLNGCEFEVDDCNDTKFYIFESDEEEDTFTVSMDIRFKNGQFSDESVAPYMVINEHETGMENVEDLIGTEYSVEDVEEADDREDTLYLFEHEPYMNYRFRILDKEDDIVHVTISGTAITDGYAEPPVTADFEGEFWLRCSMD